MDVETKVAEEQAVNTPEQVVTESTPVLSAEDLGIELEKVRATNARLLAESKDHKAKYQGLREKVQTEHEKSLEEQGKWKELYEEANGRVTTYEQQLADERKRATRTQLNFEVARFATDAHDVADVIANLPSELIHMTEEGIEGVSEAVKWVKENKKYLFKTEQPGMVNKRPILGQTETDLTKLSQDDKMKLLAEALGKDMKR